MSQEKIEIVLPGPRARKLTQPPPPKIHPIEEEMDTSGTRPSIMSAVARNRFAELMRVVQIKDLSVDVINHNNPTVSVISAERMLYFDDLEVAYDEAVEQIEEIAKQLRKMGWKVTFR